MKTNDNGNALADFGGDWFTGTVRIDALFQAPDPAFVQGASVTFEPGARTAWRKQITLIYKVI